MVRTKLGSKPNEVERYFDWDSQRRPLDATACGHECLDGYFQLQAAGCGLSRGAVGKKLTFVIIRLHLAMTFTVKQLDEFSGWLKSLKDSLTRQRLVKRLRKAQLGNLGDVEKVGEGVFEMREHFGPGWRMYYIQHGELLIVMLGGGDKSTQQADIRRALALAKTMEN